jgi:cobalamin biosynthesis protein CobW
MTENSSLEPKATARRKVGVTVVSGFLGSGKTTLLRRVLSDPAIGPEVAVIVNDVGELGLDPALLRSAGSTKALHVTELISGCICCTLTGELTTALRSLVRGDGLKSRPEHIFIEPSGIARASEVSFAVNAVGFEEPLETDAVVTLVDARHARRSHREHAELFEDQLRSADLVVLNKLDLLPEPTEQQALQAWLRPFAPRATFLRTERAAIDPALLLGRVEGRVLDPTPRGSSHEHDIAAVTLPVPFVVERAALEDFLDTLAERIFRIKGLVDARWPGEAAGSMPTLVQAVGDRVELDLVPLDSALAKDPRRLIFIGAKTALGADGLREGLRQLAVKEARG